MLNFNGKYFKLDYDRADVTPRCTTVTVYEEKPATDSGAKVDWEQLPVICKGISVCGKNDRFNRVKGRKVALARALQALGWDKETRTQFWEAYFNRDPKKNMFPN